MLGNMVAVVLAGGQGRRVDYQQKALLCYDGKALLTHILDRLRPQVKDVWISANQALEQYRTYEPRVFVDETTGFLGPMEGMNSAWQATEADWLVFVPCDNPFFPEDLVEKLCQKQAETGLPLVVAHDGERMQPLYCLMSRTLHPSLGAAIAQGHLSVWRWITENAYAEADFSQAGPAAFQNLNTLALLSNDAHEKA